MSHNRRKATFLVQGAWGATEKDTVYVDYDNSCDIATVYDRFGNHLFSFEDTEAHNLLEAISAIDRDNNGVDVKAFDIQPWTQEERQMIKEANKNPGWHDISKEPRRGTKQIYGLDDDGDYGTFFVTPEGWERDVKEYGILKWHYLPNNYAE